MGRELARAADAKRTADDKALRASRELESQREEIQLSESMRRELDDIRGDFHQFLNASRGIVKPVVATSPSSSGLLRSHGKAKLAQAMAGGSPAVSPVRQIGDTSGHIALAAAGATPGTMALADLGSGGVGGGGTEIRISRRGSVRVTAHSK